MSTQTLGRPEAASVTTRSRSNPPPPEVDLLLEHISPGEVVFNTSLRRTTGDRGGPSPSRVGTTLLDFALGAAVQSVVPPGGSYRAVRLAVTVTGDDPRPGRLEAEAFVVRRVADLVVATGHVRSAGGRGEVTGRLVARVLGPRADDALGW